MIAPKISRPKVITLADFDAVLAGHGHYTFEDRVEAEQAGDNRMLFQQFMADQWQLLQMVVALRFPFGAYVRDEIAEALADRECCDLAAGESASDYDARHEAAKRRVYGCTLEMRRDRRFLGEHRVVKDRFRTARLRYIHGAAVRAGDLFEQLEAAAGSGDAQALADAQTNATLWIANNLSCGALLQMVNVAQSVGLPVGPDAGDAAMQQRLFDEMVRQSRKVEGFRNQLVKLNLGIAKRHAELAPAVMDANSRLSFAFQGLLEAVDRYSPTLPAPFEGFAPTWVSQAIKRGLQQSAGLISTPINVQKNAANVRQYVAQQMERGRSRLSITKDEMLRHVRDAADNKPISAAALDKALAAPFVDSLDAPLSEGGEDESDHYQQLAAEEPDAATHQMRDEREELLKSLVYDNTTAAERVILSLSSEWGNMIELTKEFLDELILSSERSTRDRIDFRKPARMAELRVVA